MIPNDYKLLSRLIENTQKKNSIKLTSDHVTKFKNLFQSFSQSEPTSLADKISKEFEELIRNCDVHSHTSKDRLFHLSHIILNHFSSKSIFWILCIYKKVMQEDLSSDPSLHKFIPHISQSHPEKTAKQFTCVDLVKQAPHADSLEKQYEYAKTLVRLISHKIYQENNN